MQLYPEQMEDILIILRGLNRVSKELSLHEKEEIVYPNKIEIRTNRGELLGYATDEIGGSFSFVDRGWFSSNQGE